MTFGKANILRRTYRHVRLYRQILSVIIRYGFGDILDRVPLRKSLEARVRAVSGKPIEGLERLTRAERVRLAMEELGPTFIKLGQILSTRPRSRSRRSRRGTRRPPGQCSPLSLFPGSEHR